MREFKFRVWHNELKEFTENRHHYSPSLIDGKISNNNGVYVIEQFTGLHDKNGKEIYEGDIVKVIYGIPHTHSLLLVEWGSKNHPDCLSSCTHGLDNKITGWWWKDLTNGHDCPMFVTDDFEVIGNIHETPELLNSPLP